MSDPERRGWQGGVGGQTEDNWSDIDESLLAQCDHLGMLHPTYGVYCVRL